MPKTNTIGIAKAQEINFLQGATSNIQAQLNAVTSNAFKLGDVIFNTASPNVAPSEMPLGMGIMTLKKEFFPELAEVLKVETDTFTFGVTAGDFVRLTGGNAGAVNAHQDDAIRNITGTTSFSTDTGLTYATVPKGCFGSGATLPRNLNTGGNPCQELTFDASSSVPTAAENRPVNTACYGRTPAGSNFNHKAYIKWKDEPNKTVYVYQNDDNEYMYEVESPINFFESTEEKIVYWYENASKITDKKPLIDPEQDKAICFNTEHNIWEYVDDFRGKTAYLKTDSSVTIEIKKIGVIDSRYTLVEPPVIGVDYYEFIGGVWVINTERKTVYDLVQVDIKYEPILTDLRESYTGATMTADESTMETIRLNYVQELQNYKDEREKIIT